MAINEKSKIFWYGINDKVTVGEYGGEWGLVEYGGKWWEYGKLGGVWKSMDSGRIGQFSVVWGVGSNMEGICKEWGSVGGEVRNVMGYGEVWGEARGGVGGVRRSVRKMWEVCCGVKEVRGDVGGVRVLSPHFPTPQRTSLTSPTTQHTSPYFSPHTSFQTPPHLPHTFPTVDTLCDGC